MKENSKSLNAGAGQQSASPASAPTPPIPVEKKKRNRKPPTTDTLVGALQIQLREARPVQRCIDEIGKMSSWGLAQVISAYEKRAAALQTPPSLINSAQVISAYEKRAAALQTPPSLINSAQ